jgi:hypothetical protein
MVTRNTYRIAAGLEYRFPKLRNFYFTAHAQIKKS